MSRAALVRAAVLRVIERLAPPLDSDPALAGLTIIVRFAGLGRLKRCNVFLEWEENGAGVPEDEAAGARRPVPRGFGP